MIIALRWYSWRTWCRSCIIGLMTCLHDGDLLLSVFYFKFSLVSLLLFCLAGVIHSLTANIYIALRKGDYSEVLPTPAWPNNQDLSCRINVLCNKVVHNNYVSDLDQRSKWVQ